ncbi:MAG: hypothetical protein K0S47_3578 [Herbinix sp.]|jgi:hypothetical protein|nr:hypothetical protein [Herbinix sp.]
MDKHYLYIVLTRTNTGISKLIQIIKKDNYTHAAISLDRELDRMYSFGRRKTCNPFIGRFIKEDLNEGIYKSCKTIPGVIIELEVSRQQYQSAKERIDHFINNSNLYKYNYKGLLHCLLNKTAYSDDRFLCSEFVYYILEQSGIADLKMSRNLVRPQNLLDIQGSIIYNGNLKELKLAKNMNLYNKQIQTRRMSEIYE